MPAQQQIGPAIVHRLPERARLRFRSGEEGAALALMAGLRRHPDVRHARWAAPSRSLTVGHRPDRPIEAILKDLDVVVAEPEAQHQRTASLVDHVELALLLGGGDPWMGALLTAVLLPRLGGRRSKRSLLTRKIVSSQPQRARPS